MTALVVFPYLGLTYMVILMLILVLGVSFLIFQLYMLIGAVRRLLRIQNLKQDKKRQYLIVYRRTNGGKTTWNKIIREKSEENAKTAFHMAFVGCEIVCITSV